jgi:hypothetical protein
MKSVFFLVVAAIIAAGWALAEDGAGLTASSSYDGFISFETLIIFWVGIIGLLILIRMKLKEVERTRKMNLDKNDGKETPLLD